jgi:hypothetical protein
MLKKYMVELKRENRIHAANELLEIYLELGEMDSIADLLTKEEEILPTRPQTPYKHLSLGIYYQLKAAFQLRTGFIDDAMESYANSLQAYGAINAYEDIINCTSEIISYFSKSSTSIKFQYVEKLKNVYNSIMDKNNRKRRGWLV